jgi:hypothetical protein
MPGYNPIHGYDTGPPPPPYNPNGGSLPVQVVQGYAPAPHLIQPVAQLVPQYVPYSIPYPWAEQQYIIQRPQPQQIYVHQPPPQPIHIQQPAPQHVHFTSLPANAGVQAGYDYFPQECCKIHLILGSTPPWELPANYSALQHIKRMVPINTKMADVMKNFGCTGADPAKNILFEVQEAGNGRWVKGMAFKVSIYRCLSLHCLF